MIKRLIVFSVVVFCFAGVASAQVPRGSITIERISEIKYPSSPVWSPDGRVVAFLWDAWGKQDLFVVTPGKSARALTDFQVDPDLLVSDIDAIDWVSPDEILFSKDGRLWTVSPASAKPMRYPQLADAADFTLSPDKKLIAFTRQGDLWYASLQAKTQRQVTVLPEEVRAGHPVFSRDGSSLAFIAMRRTSLPQSVPLPF